MFLTDKAVSMSQNVAIWPTKNSSTNSVSSTLLSTSVIWSTQVWVTSRILLNKCFLSTGCLSTNFLNQPIVGWPIWLFYGLDVCRPFFKNQPIVQLNNGNWLTLSVPSGFQTLKYLAEDREFEYPPVCKVLIILKIHCSYFYLFNMHYCCDFGKINVNFYVQLKSPLQLLTDVPMWCQIKH
jgi:hypothetical protein